MAKPSVTSDPAPDADPAGAVQAQPTAPSRRRFRRRWLVALLGPARDRGRGRRRAAAVLRFPPRRTTIWQTITGWNHRRRRAQADSPRGVRLSLQGRHPGRDRAQGHRGRRRANRRQWCAELGPGQLGPADTGPAGRHRPLCAARPERPNDSPLRRRDRRVVERREPGIRARRGSKRELGRGPSTRPRRAGRHHDGNEQRARGRHQAHWPQAGHARPLGVARSPSPTSSSS